MEKAKVEQKKAENEAVEAENKAEEVVLDGPGKEFAELLEKENFLLDNITAKQIDLRKVITKKDWDAFIPLMNELNNLADRFQKADALRDELQQKMDDEALKPHKELLGSLREKLLKCKVETQVIQNYVSTTKEFIAEVVQKAIPKERNKNYTQKGEITDARKSNILLDIEL